jgi:HK97 gp10 family phage protein
VNPNIRIEGLDDALSALDRLGADGRREGARAVAQSVQKVRADAIKSIQRGGKSGRLYERGKGRNLSPTHRASAPGEAPATDTGTLVGSISAVSSGLSGKVGSRLQYSFWLEYGTRRMGARPFLRPTVEQNSQFIIDAFERAMKRATERFGR